ncbi:anaerobic glycerol-3-phosphate dehydrogenase subunit C [Fuerstiella marisgermanici]|uniref:Anaerobic glycerol-3-phosphate dehydrogenase subunit C n=1 Tax=Fuerstiella marisgermanici TaxID=1891926 RepID=A0A1P8WMN5_9PLAN|nr:anaerobic glycerol-3-phosphate dehydrogenase subunit C [Fuerstiella marisgermanici]APZ95325.1 Anaerobic glycerol-3-phosphate dehydrogenase subunit C [Fuerstiella marisgermanici]
MEEARLQIAEDLTDLLEGELRVDNVTTAVYATDASLYEIKPLAVAFPKHTTDVATLARYASDNDVALIPRGAGTGLAGGCLGAGIVVDFSRHMNRLLSVDGDTVRVQPGITLAELNRTLRQHGRCFAPDPSNAAITTIGGMLGVDAAGSHAFRVGSTRDHVKSLQCVLMGGQVMELGCEQVPRSYAIRQPDAGFASSTDLPRHRDFVPPVRNESLPLTSLTPLLRKTDLVERLAALLAESTDLIKQHQPVLLRNSSGYMLRSVLNRGVQDQGVLNFPRLIAGSEGSLAMATEVLLHTMPLPEHRGMMVLMFASMDSALLAMQQLLILEPSACDLLDRRLLSLGRDSDSRFSDVVDPDAEAGLFVEFNGSSKAEIEQRIDNAESILSKTERQFVVTRKTCDIADVEFLWTLPGRVVSLLDSLKGTSRPLPFVEDIAVPPEEISGFLTLAQRTFQKHEVTATLYAHAASGQLHLRPMLPRPRPGHAEQLESIARDLYRHVKTVGGTISGEHGDGLSRTAFIRSMYGPLYRTFQQVKDIFDPQHLLNPDKIISNDGQLTVRHLRGAEAQPLPKTVDEQSPLLPILQLSWDGETAMDAAARCNGCGTCRTTSPTARMCPFFHEDGVEENSPRSKANLLRRLISGREPAEIVIDKAVQPVVESCFNCKQCVLECPSEVDIPHLMLEARAEHVAVQGLGKTDWLMSRFHTYARFASRFTMMANRMLRLGVSRSVLNRMLGIAEQRRLPRFASRPFMKSRRVQSEHNTADPTSSTPTIAYFVDYFANHHDPELAEAFVRILQHNGFRIYIPPDQKVSGMAMIAVADLAAAREVAETNVAELTELAREGYPIVCTEPSAALCLSQEYPLLLGTEDAQIVADHTFDAGTFLWQLHQDGKLKLDFDPVELTVAYHTPCHVKALGPDTGLCNLLELIPGVQVQRIEKGCSGMAGTFGLAAEHFEKSLAIGAELIQEMKTTHVNAGVTDCSSCRMQMEQQATIPTVHPLKIMAMAYGLMPELQAALKKRPWGYSMS